MNIVLKKTLYTVLTVTAMAAASEVLASGHVSARQTCCSIDSAEVYRASWQAWTAFCIPLAVWRPTPEIYRSFQHDFPARLHCGETATTLWLHARSAHVAAAVRSLKAWVLSPMYMTRSELLS
jgi:hypothetical protein